MGNKVTSIRVDPELWKRAKIVAIEEGVTLSDLIQEAISIVVDWRWLVDELQLNVDMNLLEKMIEAKSRGRKPFVIVSDKTAVELVREGRDRWL
ncbi:MAG: hypothetical protein Q6363_003320 [Candidatus Njordarchaeota archaeon]